MITYIKCLSPLRAALLTVPLLMSSTAANAVLIITASLNGGANVVVQDETPGVDLANGTPNAVAGFFIDGDDSIFVTADSTSPYGTLNDTQIAFNLIKDATGSISVIDNAYEVNSDGSYIFTSLFNSANISSNLQLLVEVLVNGFTVIPSQLATTGVNIGESATIALNAGTTYSIQHLYSFLALDDIDSSSGNTFTRIPEPSILALIGIGLLGLGFRKNRPHVNKAS